MKIREMLHLLTVKGYSLNNKGKLNCSCVKSFKLYGSETWAVKMGDVKRLERTEMRMEKWMCDISLSDGSAVGRISNTQVRPKLRVESISEIMNKGRKRWLGHVGRMEG